jgi:acyl-CoA hydrolase
VLGDQRLYDMITENPGVAIMRGQYVNNPATIAKINNFVSINTGLTVDLSGQICSETIGSLHYSGSGGQADTAIGATHSKGGKNIIAIQSVKETKAGRVSCINAQLPLGSVVTLSRNDVDYIVTEYGIAPMRGRSVRQRVENLAAVAHPDYRAELRKTAEKLLLW